MRPVPEITDPEMIFGTIKHLPPMKEIPEEFKNPNNPNKWNDLVSTWFFCGLKNCVYKPKEGVDTAKAMKALKAIMASWAPQHEHKEAGVAYLMSEWFDDIEAEKADGKT
jgi:hypothetical protein